MKSMMLLYYPNRMTNQLNLRHLKTNGEASFEATPSLEGIGHIDIAAYPQYPST